MPNILDASNDGKPYSRKRMWITYGLICYMWSISVLSSYCAYHDDPLIYAKYGSPHYLLGHGNARIIMSYFMIAIAISALMRTIGVIKESQNQLFVIDLLRMLYNGSNCGLNERNVQRLSLRIAIHVDILCKYGPLLGFFLYLTLHIILCSYAMYDQMLDESLIPYIITGICYSILVYYMIRIYIVDYLIFYITQKFLKYRFEQVDEMIKRSKTWSKVIEALREHDLICMFVYKNNKLMGITLFVGYYLFAPMVDLMIYQAFHSNNVLFVQMFFRIAGSIFMALLFVFAYSSAQLYKAAHSPYHTLNGILAKLEQRQHSNQNKWFLHRMQRIKIAFYIERFSGPAITTYCLDLFPLTYYEFYLFVSSVCTNYILINNLL
jgi:hypothetical protein